MNGKEEASRPELIVVGSLGLDTVETPHEKREDLLGGSVSYACSGASFFTRVGMVAVAGEDFPSRHRATYERFGIDLAGLQIEQGKTFRWSGVYEENMNDRETLSTDLNVFEAFSPHLPESYVEAPFFLLGNISPELQLHVLSQAKSPRFVLADTMDLWINIARHELEQVIARVDMLCLNDSEAHLLTDEHNLKKCAEKIMDMGPQYVVIKKGEHGGILFSDGGIFIVPAFPVDEIRDATGAGDSFAGGFMGALAKAGRVDNAVIRKSLIYGAVVASFGVEEFSLERLSELTFDEIEERLALLEGMITP
jgi:sugar/nucleoside kinase (ribokinase family)